MNVESPAVQTTIGVLTAALSLALLHIPAYLIVRGQALGAIIGILVLLTATGIMFGDIYAATRNLCLVMFLHSVGNLWPLGVDRGAGIWPNWGVILVMYVFVAVVYRQWKKDLTLPIPGQGATN